VGIQACVRHWAGSSPNSLFEKVVRRGQEDENQPRQTCVEWMHDDALDGWACLLNSSIWEKDGTLKRACKDWEMMRRLTDPDKAGKVLIPGRDFEYRGYMHSLRRLHKGEVAEVDGDWLKVQGAPPNCKNYWHCQYALSDDQWIRMAKCRCRGTPQQQNDGKVDWEHAPGELTRKEMLDIGSTSVCSLPHEDLRCHLKRRAFVITYPRLLCFLIGQQDISIHTADAWWKNARKICGPKGRLTVKSDEDNAKCWKRFEETGKWGKGAGADPQDKGNGDPKPFHGGVGNWQCKPQSRSQGQGRMQGHTQTQGRQQGQGGQDRGSARAWDWGRPRSGFRPKHQRGRCHWSNHSW